MIKSIKGQLALAFGAMMLLALGFASWDWVSDQRIQGLNSVSNRYQTILRAQAGVADAQQRMLMNDRISMEFMTSGESANTLLRDSNHEVLTTNLEVLLTDEFVMDFGLQPQLENALDQAEIADQIFVSLKDSLLVRGFKDYGAEGQLREAIHSVEDISADYDRAYMLMLRRHEKDFFLRKDLKYLNKFEQSLAEFKAHLKHQRETATDTTPYVAILDDLDDYQRRFSAIVALEERIGFDSYSGLIGKLNQKQDELRASLALAEQKLNAEVEAQIALSDRVSIGVLIALLVCGGLMTVIFTRRVANSILSFKERIEVLADGDFPQPFKVDGKDEISRTRQVFNNFLGRLKAATSFADAIGNGELNLKYDERFQEDVLAKSLQSMQSKLQQNAEREEVVRWQAQGHRMLSEALNESDDLRTVMDKALGHITEYCEAQTALLFRFESSDQNLRAVSSFAHTMEVESFPTIAVGEGITGEVFRQNQKQVLTNLPAEFGIISSGLGSSPPVAIAFLPVESNDIKVGVLEIATLQPFTDAQVDFLSDAAKTIAITFIARQWLSDSVKQTGDKWESELR